MQFVTLATITQQTVVVTPRSSGQVLRLGATEVVTVAGIPARVYGTGTVELSEGYWDECAVVDGDYTGPAFNGSSSGDGERMYMWAGAPDNSESLKVLIDASDQGNPGRVTLTNTGTAPTEPVVKIYGGMTEGFELLHIETGHIIRCTRPIPDGSYIRVDNAAGELWIDDQSPLPSTYIPVAEWFQAGPGETCTIQWTPLGATTGEPRIVVEGASASW